MPGRIRVSVLESLEISAELPENGNATLEVSVGDNVYHTKLDKKAGGKLEASESQFEFPVLRFQDNVRVAILDSNGDAVSQTEIETPMIIESGLLDNLFPLKGGGNIHLKLCFVLSSEEYKQIQALRETACKKKQSACFKWNPYLVTNEVAATKPISGEDENKDKSSKCNANNVKANKTEEAKTTEDKSEELKMSPGCIQSVQLSEKLSRHEVDKEIVNFGVLQEAENFPMFSAVDQNAKMLLIEDRSDIVLRPNKVEREILSETEVSAHKSYVCSNANKILGHECHSFHDSNILQELKSKDLPLFKNKRVTANQPLLGYTSNGSSHCPSSMTDGWGDRNKGSAESGNGSWTVQSLSLKDENTVINGELDAQKQAVCLLSETVEQLSTSASHAIANSESFCKDEGNNTVIDDLSQSKYQNQPWGGLQNTDPQKNINTIVGDSEREPASVTKHRYSTSKSCAVRKFSEVRSSLQLEQRFQVDSQETVHSLHVDSQDGVDYQDTKLTSAVVHNGRENKSITGSDKVLTTELKPLSSSDSSHKPLKEYVNSLSSVNIPCKKEDNYSTAFPLVLAERINIITDQVQPCSETNITSHVSVASASLSQPTVLQQENTSPSKRSSSGTNVEGQLNNVPEVQEFKKQKSRYFDNLRKIDVANQLPSVSLETEKVKSKSTSFKNSSILRNTLRTPSASFHRLVNSQAYNLTACPQKLTGSEPQEMKRTVDLQGNVKKKIMTFEGGLPQRRKKIFLYNNVKAKIKAFESTLSQEPGRQRNYPEKFEHKTVNRNVSKQPIEVIVTEYKGNLRQGNVRTNKSCQLTESKSDVHKRLKRTHANTQVMEDMKENEMGTIFKDIIISKNDSRRDDIFTANEQANPIALKKHAEVVDGCQKGFTISMKHMQIKDKCHLEEFDATKDEIKDFENEQEKPGESRLLELKRNWHDKAMNLSSATDTVSMNNESRQCASTNIIETQHASQWGHNLKQIPKLSKAEEAELQTLQALGAGINFTDCAEQMENAEETIESLRTKRIENNFTDPDIQGRGRSVAREPLSSQMSPGLTVSVDVTKSDKDPQKVSKNNTKSSGGIVKQGLAATVVLAVGTVFVWARRQKMGRGY